MLENHFGAMLGPLGPASAHLGPCLANAKATCQTSLCGKYSIPNYDRRTMCNFDVLAVKLRTKTITAFAQDTFIRRAQEHASAAHDDGARGISGMARLGASGSAPQNMERDLYRYLRRSGRTCSLQPYLVVAPFKQPDAYCRYFKYRKCLGRPRPSKLPGHRRGY